jgi:hypothetical protein
MLVAALPARGSPRPAVETRARVSLLFMWLGLFCGWGLLSRRPRHVSSCFSASTSCLFFCSRPLGPPRPITPDLVTPRPGCGRVRSVERVSHQQRQLSNSHSRMVRGLPVRRSISRHGFTEFVPRETAVPSVSSGPSSLRTFSPSCWQLSSCRRLSSRLQSRRSALRSG